MATLTTREQIDSGVLLQPRTLESRPVDNPGEEESGHRGWKQQRSDQHGRGETADGSPHRSGVTPGRGEAREGHARVFVLSKEGTPLDPCHPARARKLLAKGRAVVVRHTPFVIRMKDRAIVGSQIEGVELGIDPGARHTGLAVFGQEKGMRRGLFAMQLDHRGDQIARKMARRAGYRRRRRAANLRNRAPRFSNRARASGWLAPSLSHRVATTKSWVERIQKWAPVRAVHIESSAFDIAELAAGRSLDAVEYQQGALHGYEVRQYLLEKWNRACAYCDATGVPLNIDHIRSRANGGSDRVSNLTIACVACNQAKGSKRVEEFLADDPGRLKRVLDAVSVRLRDAAAMNATKHVLVDQVGSMGLPVFTSSGARTKWNRHRTELSKSHTLDALHVGELEAVQQWPSQVLVATCTGRGSRVRTNFDRFGFPKASLPSTKRHHGLATGDLVRAIVPRGKQAGSHVGRVAVRRSGFLDISTHEGRRQGISHKYCRLLQRADGYGYTLRGETS